ncbi:MAG: ATP-binding protein [Defluviitaleaceae bacterium]|nr:ATP-binding protein [Defluviitaleaceae bacterium]MCL2264223.1 ATP-binding protein [Defluviitaleaceae bacterium]
MGVLNIKAVKENTGVVLDFVTAELENNNFPADLHSDILVAAEEIFVNIASYAYGPEPAGEVIITSNVTDEATFTFEDRGKTFNPLENVNPDLSSPLAERKIGGLGLHFVKSLMDKTEYRRDGDKNILMFAKAAK